MALIMEIWRYGPSLVSGHRSANPLALIMEIWRGDGWGFRLQSLGIRCPQIPVVGWEVSVGVPRIEHMFEGLDELAERLLATAPAQDNPCEPTLDPDGSLVAHAIRLEQVKSAADAEQMLVYAALCARAETWQRLHDDSGQTEVGPADLVAAEIAPALHLAPVTAAIRVNRATDIADRLPATLAAYRRGALDLGRVLTISEATCVLSDADTAKVEELVLPAAVDQTAGELRAALRRAVIAVDPAGGRAAPQAGGQRPGRDPLHRQGRHQHPARRAHCSGHRRDLRPDRPSRETHQDHR